MLLDNISLNNVSDAEASYREAFERLKINKPKLLPKGTAVSQNNVAKEAGRDPSALKKSRFPILIAEIQRWVREHASSAPCSEHQKILVKRRRNRELKKIIQELKVERDNALSLLLEADEKILELLQDIASLQSQAPQSNVVFIRGKDFDGDE